MVKTTANRILTTHTGSLPRPDDLVELLWRQETGESIDQSQLATRTTTAVRQLVDQQIATGLDIVNDGEASKLSYATYVRDRLSGFEARPDIPSRHASDMDDFPSYASRLEGRTPRQMARFACVGPIAYQGQTALQTDLANLRSATEQTRTTATATATASVVFMTAASPGVIALFQLNRHYPSHEAYIWAIAEAMREEYEAIYRAGFIVQIDCPDLAAGFHFGFEQLSRDAFVERSALHIAAINHAVAAIPPDRMRLHLCWGNYEGPHHHDIPLREIVSTVLDARPAGLSFEAANPRHAHEWRVWEDVSLPADKVLIPGVIDTTTNFIEHPDLVAERVSRFASIVGPDRVIAGADCGFATVAGSSRVFPSIAWAKLGALVEGTRRASASL